MATVDLATLFVAEAKEAIYAKGLQIATALGLDTTTWAEGDPTNVDFWFISELLELVEQVITIFIEAGFLDSATGSWLKVHVYQQFGVVVADATYATCQVLLTNGGGGVYTPTAGSLTFKNTATGKTYRNTTGGSLLGVGSTLLVDVVADEAGSASNAAIGEIDALVTVLRGVTVANTTVAVGQDEPSEAAIREQARDKLGALSPNGPRDAYSYVAKTVPGITRVRVYDDSDTGDVVGYFAGPAGAVTDEVRDAGIEAILADATPLCITPDFDSATTVSVPITYSFWVYASDAREISQIEDAVEAALETMFAARPIGGDIIPPATTGALYQSLIESTIKSVSPLYAFRVVVSTPAGDTAIDNHEVAALGAITPTVVKVADP